jgi:hypothetical protein
MGMFRKAGERLRAFDDAYAEKIMQMYTPKEVNGQHGGMEALNVIKGFAGGLLGGSPMRKISTEFSEPMFPGEKQIITALDLVSPVSSAAVRYGAPAGALALGVKGIVDTVNPQEQTAQAVMP